MNTGAAQDGMLTETSRVTIPGSLGSWLGTILRHYQKTQNGVVEVRLTTYIAVASALNSTIEDLVT